jgi:hypothetical protein
LLLALSCNLAVARPSSPLDVNVQQTTLTNNFLSVYETGQVIRTILDTLHWKANFMIQEQNGINNAYATIINGQRYIIYDNRFLNKLDQVAGTQWASISVIAHEIGHHYYNHLVSGNGSSPEKELQADYFSGYVMAKLGATTNDATVAMRKISPVYAIGSHPGAADRVNTIEAGWNDGKTALAGNNPPVPQVRQNSPVVAANNTGRNRMPQARQNPTVLTDNDSGDWIHMYSKAANPMTVYLSDDGRTFNPALVKTTQPFVFKFEIYDYGYLRFSNDRRAPAYKLVQGRDYSIVWDQRSNNWTVMQVS